MGKTLCVIQTSAVSCTEISQLCKEYLPGVKYIEIIDSTLIDEVVGSGGVTPSVRRRLLSYYDTAERYGADVILNQCSSVGEVVEIGRQLVSIPIIKVDEPMMVKAVGLGTKIALVATVATTVGPSGRLLRSVAEREGKDITVTEYLEDGAMLALMAGDRDKHNSVLLSAIEKAAAENDVVVLAQGSMTAILPLIGHIDKPVLTSPKLAFEYLKEFMG
ncbi:MAG: aspartate/glutamate racemase family protein [Oscillospiraceae bacterium]|nr:aspartate/glutamate racemase family protein [Oscillospiraceae bacterium]